MSSTDPSKAKGTEGSGSHKRYSTTSQLHQIYAGAAAGCLTRFLTQPFDVLKIRFQLQVEPLKSKPTDGTLSPSKYTSVLQACRLIYKEEGIPAFFKGHNAGQILSILYSISQFWSFEQVNLYVQQNPIMTAHPNVGNFLSGSIAGCFSSALTTPFDVIRTRLVAQDPGAGYHNTMRAIPIIIRKEGIYGLYRGLTPALVQVGPLVGSNFMFYNIFNNFIKNALEPPSGHLPTWILLVTGGLAGILAKVLLYPLDFIKKRLQLIGFEDQRQTFGHNQQCTSVFHCIKLTIQKEGFLGFYKGMTPTLAKSGLTTAFYFSIYDKVRDWLNDETS